MVRPDVSGDADGPDAARRALSVSELNRVARRTLEGTFGEAWIEGEVSGFRAWQSGHWYLTLKDDSASVQAVMFRGANRHCRVRPSDGMLVLVRGRVTVYEQRGTFQVVVEHLEPAGEGALMIAFAELKRRLAAEGLFDRPRRPLPLLPRRIGIATSRHGAALRDVLQVLETRAARVQVVVAHCRVQGEGAAEEIAAALARLSRLGDLDAIVVTRGGGSLEDLWAFNEEVVARAIAALPVPVISAVGHEIDTTIADLVADVRAATPSQAGELVSASHEDVRERLLAALARLRRATRQSLVEGRARLGLVEALRVGASVRRLVEARAQRLDYLLERLARSARHRVAERRARFAALRDRLSPRHQAEALRRRRARLGERLDRLRDAGCRRLAREREGVVSLRRALAALSPLSVLDRGYAVLQRADGAVVRSAVEVDPNERLAARLARGGLELSVTRRLPAREDD